MNKPIIGINCNIKPHEGIAGVLNVDQLYAEAVYLAGGIPQIIPHLTDSEAITELIELYDGLLMTGGGGLLPSIADMEVLPGLKDQNPVRHPFDLALINAAMKKKIPILGVCRGHQTINEALGGAIENLGDTSHLQSPLGKETLHPISVNSDSILKSCLNSTVVNVNSYHRQRIQNVGKGLKISAYAPDGTIEAIEGTDYPFLLGVQFHPEFLIPDPQMLAIYKAFVQAAS